MRCYLLLAFFALSAMRGVTQPVHSLSRSETTSPHFPTANQFEHLSTDDGLSNNSVTAILQDRAGFMWFGTKEGLNKYDGHTFTLFRPNLSTE